MQRKVIGQGNDTLTITLPRAWTQKYGIKAKGNVQLKVRDHVLEVCADAVKHDQKVRFHFDLPDYHLIRWTLGAFFRAGFDELYITYGNEGIFSSIQDVLKKKFIGFIITEQGRNSCVIKSISTDDEATLPVLLRRNFLMVTSFADNILELYRSREFSKLEDITYLHDNSDQAIGLCQRIIIKNRYGDLTSASFEIALLENLELVCDTYREICEIGSSLKKPFKNESVLLELLEGINRDFRELSSLIFDYQDATAAPLIKRIYHRIDRVEHLYSRPEPQELIFLFHLHLLLENIKKFFPTMIVLETARLRSSSD